MCGLPRGVTCLLIAAVVQTAPVTADVQAAEAGEREILAALPADTMAVLIVRDLAQCDREVATLLARMGLPISPYSSLKGALEIVTGLDDHGPAAVALIPSLQKETGPLPLVLLLPTSNRPAAMAFLNPQPLENDYVRVTLRGHEAFAATEGRFLVFGPTLAMVQHVLDAEEGLDTVLSTHQLTRFADTDVSILVRSPLPKTVLACDMFGSPLVRGLCEACEAEFPWDRFQFCANIDGEGVTFEFNIAWKSGADIGPGSGPTTSLLNGLPDEPSAIAMGMSNDRTGARVRSMVKILFHTLTTAAVLEPSRAEELRDAYEQTSERVARVASSVSILPGEPGGSIGFAKILRARGNGRALLNGVDGILAILRSGPFVDPRFNRLTERIEYRVGVESLSDLTINHLALDLRAFSEIDHEMVRRVFGQEDLRARIALVDGDFLVVTFGGGLERFRKTVTAVRAQSAPPAAEARTVQPAHLLQKRRSFEAHVAVDRLVMLVRQLRTAMGMSPGPAKISAPGAPIVVTGHVVAEHETQVQVFVPIKVVFAFQETIVSALTNLARSDE